MNNAHDRDPSALHSQPITWHAPTPTRPFRRCSYCGSIHPHDLLDMLKDGDEVTKADEKHGWPHKFYTSEFHRFYAAHMLDAGEDFETLSILIFADTGISFEKEPSGGLYYRRTPT